ncbi:MAG: alpha-mannosidase, partial [Candidatus Latescibacteria bacterium]|nr:alpha-mannosidase [Candidatus Latescibacterota bacterium]
MKKRIAEGRWEPNGGMYVEADCNLPSGESLIRQFLKGQHYNKKHFSYQSDTFWLPDTFGYNAALPQIMNGCGISYFCTTKLDWNETNVFPYDSFKWKGIDQSEVIVHFNDTHNSPNPQNLNYKIYGGKNSEGTYFGNPIKHPDVNQSKLISFGIGDGGGGPDYDMLEEAKRVKSLPGCPVAKYSTVSEFMIDLSKKGDTLPIFKGELYLEGHRGTLTQMAAIKRYNRKIEIALKQWEMLLCFSKFSKDIEIDWQEEMTQLNKWWHGLMLNQFHDIIPGTCIPEEHDRALRDYQTLSEQITNRRAAFCSSLATDVNDSLSLVNLHAWSIQGITKIVLPSAIKDLKDTFTNSDGITFQAYKNLSDEQCVSIDKTNINGYAIQTVSLDTAGQETKEIPFEYKDHILNTPMYRVTFDQYGYIESLWDKEEEREIRGEGASLSCLWMGEDVPMKWDNWDIDYDQKHKMKLV